MWSYQRGEVLIRSTIDGDVQEIQDRLRKSDIQEIWASTHMTPSVALEYSRQGSPFCQTVLFKSSPVAMFGTAPMRNVNRAAGVWFVATDDLRGMWISFLRMSKPCIERMLDDYPLLFNWVDARNVDSVAWLSWCGAKIEDAKPFGPDSQPFHFFTIKRSDLCVQP